MQSPPPPKHGPSLRCVNYIRTPPHNLASQSWNNFCDCGPPSPQTWTFTPLCQLHTNPPITWPLNPGIIFVIAVPPPPQTWPFTLLCQLHMNPPYNLASQSQNNLHHCSTPLPPQTWPFTPLCQLHMKPPPTTWALNPGIIFVIAVPPPPNMALHSVVSITYKPPPITWPVNPQILNVVINTYTKRFLLIRDLRILKLTDFLETHFFSINASVQVTNQSLNFWIFIE